MGKVAPERIQRFRTELGYTQEDLADLCGVDASCISRWETGEMVAIGIKLLAVGPGAKGFY